MPAFPPGDAGELKLETQGEHITTHARITLDTQLYGLEHRLCSLQKVVALFFTVTALVTATPQVIVFWFCYEAR